jgi:protein-disulfide isomerase
MTLSPLARLALCAAAAFGIATNAPALQAASPFASQVTRGADGSHILGNPDAAIKLVEYVSYTCPHCASFVSQSSAALRRDVAAGRLSIEVRHLVLSAPDIGMTVAANCGSPSRFFSRHDALMALQPTVLARASAMTQQQADRIRALAPLPRIRALAQETGVIGWMRQRGFTATQIDACFADQTIVDRIEAMRSGALAAGVTGTPTFAINGRILPEAHSWASLQPELARASAPDR